MSTATLTPPLPAPAGHRPPPRRFTVAEFHHMGTLGWFKGRRAFLLDGFILENGPMDPRHGNAIGLGQYVLQAAFGPTYWVRVQLPLSIDEYNDPLPDFAVVPGSPRDYPGVHATTAALVVEVADTSLTIDLTEKAERYATAGVADYWVLDLDGRRLFMLRDPAPLPAGLGATAYRQHLTLGPADRITPLAAPTASLAVADLLP